MPKHVIYVKHLLRMTPSVGLGEFFGEEGGGAAGPESSTNSSFWQWAKVRSRPSSAITMINFILAGL